MTKENLQSLVERDSCIHPMEADDLTVTVSFTIPKNGCFVDTVRRKVVLTADEFMKSARYLEIHLMDYLLRGMEHLQMILCRLNFEIDKDRLRPFSFK